VVKPSFTLQASSPGSDRSTIAESITINNPSAVSQTYHFYQYSDFDLAGVAGNQSVLFTASGGSYKAVQTGLAGGSLVDTVTALSSGANVQPEVQAGLYDGTQFGLMNGNPAPTLNNTLSAGLGDVVYAYEWDVTIAPTTGALTISEIQTVPEPSSVALISAGLFTVAWLARRRRERGFQA